MGFIGYLIGMVITGVVVGAISRLVIPGKQSLSIPQTALLGIAGSFVGGLIGRLLFGGGGLILSVIAGAGLLYLGVRRGKISTAR